MPIEQWTTVRTTYVDLNIICESHFISGRLIISIVVAVYRIINIKGVARQLLLESNNIFCSQEFIWLPSIIQIDNAIKI